MDSTTLGLLGSELERRRAGTVSLPVRLWIALREESEKTGVPVSRLVVRALEASGTDRPEGQEKGKR